MEITDKLIYSATQVASTADTHGPLASPILIPALVVIGGAVLIYLAYRELTFEGTVNAVDEAGQLDP